MLSTVGVVLIAAAAAFVFFVLGASTILLALRSSNKRHCDKADATRHLRNGQRMRLSVGSSNYSHIPEPGTHHRRSVILPYGIVSERWVGAQPHGSQEILNPTRETVSRPQLAAVPARPTLRNERTKSFRASFSAHSFSLPKTRRQKRIEKAIPLRALPSSPLSAITEQSGSNHTEASPSIGMAELPAEATPKSMPDRDQGFTMGKRPSSVQWPLPPSERAFTYNGPTIIPVSPSRNSTRSDISVHSGPHSPPASPLGPQASNFPSRHSAAPGEPLPPLPSIGPYQWPYGRKSNLRLSTTSVDSVGSSVLGSELASPSRRETENTSIGFCSPLMDVGRKKFPSYQHHSSEWGPATLTTGISEAKQPTRLAAHRAGYGSMKASFDTHSNSHRLAGKGGSTIVDRSSSLNRSSGCSLVTLDASNWKSGLPTRVQSLRTPQSPAYPAAISRANSSNQRNNNSRHSMFEQHSSQQRASLSSAASPSPIGQGKFLQRPSVTSRPISIADGELMSRRQGTSPHGRALPESQRKGHKRQNCVRISNLPQLNAGRRAKLPLMAEEEEEDADTLTGTTSIIPGLTLLAQGRPEVPHDRDASPFVVKPVVKPNGYDAPKARRKRAADAGKRDSDVFRISHADPTAPNIFKESPTTPRPWRLSPKPTPRSKSQITPPSFKRVEESGERDSPILPPPPVSSASIFARAASTIPGPRVSAVQGPRNGPLNGRSSRTGSPSPRFSRPGARRDDLRRSVMTLRRMNSDSKDPSRASQIYSNIGDENLALLREDKETSSATSIRLSPSKASIIDFGFVNSSPNTSLSNSKIPSSAPHHDLSTSFSSTSFLVPPGLRPSKSKGKIIPSPSAISVGASIWEDASVRGDSPEPEMPSSSQLSTPNFKPEAADQLGVLATDQGKANAGDRRRQKDKERELRLTSPQGKGLGLMGVHLNGSSLVGRAWGTPGSLYDRDGFLKE